MPAFVNNLLSFGRLLRAAGFDVPVGSMLDLLEALTHVNPGSRDEVFHASRALLVRRHEQLALFEAVFDAFWRDHWNPFAGRETVNSRDERGPQARVTSNVVIAGDAGGADVDDEEPPSLPAIRTWSEAGGLAHKDFAEFSAEELARARVALDRLSWAPGARRTRRWIRGRGPRIDLRRALGLSLRTGGDLLTLPTRTRRVVPRRLVLLCDVSGSMERYSRLLVHFAHGIGQQHRKLEVFFFSTLLTRVTRQLRARRVGTAAAAVSGAVPDWSGGTRIGPALEQFHKRWSRRVLHGEPVVLLISDGWDRGDPDLLREQVARLQRSCHRLIWLNPLIGTEGYEPLTRGLQAALPFVDDFLPARTLTDLGELARHLDSLEAGAGLRRMRRHGQRPEGRRRPVDVRDQAGRPVPGHTRGASREGHT